MALTVLASWHFPLSDESKSGKSRESLPSSCGGGFGVKLGQDSRVTTLREGERSRKVWALVDIPPLPRQPSLSPPDTIIVHPRMLTRRLEEGAPSRLRSNSPSNSCPSERSRDDTARRVLFHRFTNSYLIPETCLELKGGRRPGRQLVGVRWWIPTLFGRRRGCDSTRGNALQPDYLLSFFVRLRSYEGIGRKRTRSETTVASCLLGSVSFVLVLAALSL